MGARRRRRRPGGSRTGRAPPAAPHRRWSRRESRPPAAKVLESAIAGAVARPDRQDLVELEIGNRDREHRAPRRSVLDSAHADVEIAASDRGVDGGEGDLHEQGLATEAMGDRPGDLDVETANPRRVGRVGLDEGSAPLRVPAPAQDRGRRRSGDRDASCEWGEKEGEEKQVSRRRHARSPGTAGRASRGRRNRAKVRMPAPKPPTCAHHAIPLTSRCVAIASVPLKNCVRNQKPR